MQGFLETHQLFCRIIEEKAQNKLGRALAEAKQQAIHAIQSFLFLEMFEQDLLATQTTKEAEQWLENLIKVSRERAEREKGLSGTTEAAH